MSSFDNMKSGQVRGMISVLLVGLLLLMSAGPIMAGYSGNTISQDNGNAGSPMAFPIPWLDDFETGNFGGSTGFNWTGVLGTGTYGVDTSTSQSGIYSMYTQGGTVTLNSSSIDTSAYLNISFSCYIRKGGAFGGSEAPDTLTENIEIYYLNNVSSWVLLDTFFGNVDAPGTVYNVDHILPLDACHSNFQIRFYQTGGSGGSFDYWHIDDVYVGPPPAFSLDLYPDLQSAAGGPGSDVDHILSIDNIGTSNDTYNLSVGGNAWPVIFRDIGDTTNISNIFITNGSTGSFIARVSIPGGATSWQVDAAFITATSQGNTTDSDMVQIQTQALPPYDFDMTPVTSTIQRESPGASADYGFIIWNNGSSNDTYDLSAQNNSWPVIFRDAGDTINITTISISAGNNSQFIARVNIPGAAAKGDIDYANITATSQGNSTISDMEMIMTIVPGMILYVDDDGGAITSLNTEVEIMAALDSTGYSYDVWEYAVDGVPSAADLLVYEIIIWATGNSYDDSAVSPNDGTFSPTDRANIGTYLDAGGKLYLSSCLAGYDSVNGATWTPWYNTYLHSNYLAFEGNTASPFTINGVPGDIITDNDTYLGDQGTVNPGIWAYRTDNDPINDGHTIFTTTSTANIATRADTGTYRVVYTAFDLTAVDDSTGDRAVLLDDIIYWLLNGNVTPPYRLDVSPSYQTDASSAGGVLDYTITITNTGLLNDTYNLSVSGSTWPVTLRNAADTMDISNVMVPVNASVQVIVRVTIPGGAIPGDSNTSLITIISQNDSMRLDTAQITTDVFFTAPWLDDFEFGVFGGSTGLNWTSDNPTFSGVGTQISNSGSWSMYTSGGLVNVDSWFIDTSGLSIVEVECWIQEGSGIFSENPDGGEDLELYYMNDIGTWVWLETFFGGASEGATYDRTYLLSADAIHSSFQLRFSQTGGSGAGMDYWHIDDVYVGHPIPEVISTTPASGSAGIAIDQSVSVVYDGTMNTGSNPALVQTSGTDPGGWSFSGWSTTNVVSDTATWTHSDWTYAETIGMRVSGGTNIYGNSPPTHTWSFTTFVPDSTPPDVEAGPDRWESSAFTQYGVAIDTESGVDGYEWAQVSGPGSISFWDPYNMYTQMEADIDGTYEISFLAYDFEGNNATDSFILVWDTVIPFIDIGPNRTENKQFTQFSTVIEHGSGIDYYSWTTESGFANHIDFGSNDDNKTTIRSDIDGTFVIRLTVFDLAGNSAYDEFTLIWDTKSPMVTIAPSGDDISVDTDIAFTFNEEMDRDSVEAGMRIYRKNGEVFVEDDTITGTFIWDADGSRVAFTPDHSLSYGTEYNVMFEGAVRDLIGNKMDNDMIGAFTTEDEPIPPTGDIGGQIIDADGTPIEGALVQVVVDGDTYSQITDENGEFELLDVPVGTHDLLVSKGDYDTTIPVTVSDGQTNDLDPIELDVDNGASNWWWILLIILAMVILLIIVIIVKKNNQPPQQQYQQPPPPPPPAFVAQPADGTSMPPEDAPPMSPEGAPPVSPEEVIPPEY